MNKTIIRIDEESIVMKELRKVKEQLAKASAGMTPEEEIAHSKKVIERFEKLAGFKLKRANAERA